MSKQFTKISFKEAGEKGVTLNYKNYDQNGLRDIVSKENKNVPNSTFREAMKKLTYHLLFLTELVDVEKFSKFPDIAVENYRVTGVSLSGEGEKEGVIITGYKVLSNGKGFSFNTPLTRLEATDYVFADNLKQHLAELITQASEYLAGKYGVVQTEMFTEEPAAAAN